MTHSIRGLFTQVRGRGILGSLATVGTPLPASLILLISTSLRGVIFIFRKEKQPYVRLVMERCQLLIVGIVHGITFTID
jgi:hypothetical protein